MEKKAIALLKDHAELKDLNQKMEDLADSISQRMKFLERQFKTIQDDRDKAANDLWQEVIKIVRDKKILPSEYDEKKGWGISIGDGVLYAVHAKSAADFRQLIGGSTDILSALKNLLTF